MRGRVYNFPSPSPETDKNHWIQIGGWKKLELTHTSSMRPKLFCFSRFPYLWFFVRFFSFDKYSFGLLLFEFVVFFLPSFVMWFIWHMNPSFMCVNTKTQSTREKKPFIQIVQTFQTVCVFGNKHKEPTNSAPISSHADMEKFIFILLPSSFCPYMLPKLLDSTIWSCIDRISLEFLKSEFQWGTSANACD